MTRKVVAPVIEIVEVRKQLPLGDGVEWVMVPNDVRINGVSLLCSDDPVVVERISTSPDDAVRVTVTFLARSVFIGSVVDLEKHPNQ